MNKPQWIKQVDRYLTRVQVSPGPIKDRSKFKDDPPKDSLETLRRRLDELEKLSERQLKEMYQNNSQTSLMPPTEENVQMMEDLQLVALKMLRSIQKLQSDNLLQILSSDSSSRS